MQVLQRDFLPHDLEPILGHHGVEGTIAVQADQSEQETFFLLQLAEKHDFIKKVVGWADLRAPNVAERMKLFANYPKLAGFRHIVQAERDVNFLLREDFHRGIQALAPHGFSYDILVFPHQLGAVLEFIRQHPYQRFVIDHLAKPYVKDGFFDGWAILMREIGRYGNVFCKVSGLTTEADWHAWQPGDFTRYLDLVTAAFGTDRLMFGSDWPVCLLAGTYEKTLAVFEQYFHPFSAADKAKIFGENAARFYGV